MEWIRVHTQRISHMIKLPDGGSRLSGYAKFCIHCKSLNLEPRFRGLHMMTPSFPNHPAITTNMCIQCHYNTLYSTKTIIPAANQPILFGTNSSGNSENDLKVLTSR